MFWQQLFNKKSIDMLQEEAASENEGGHGPRLRRILGPVQLTALGVGAIIGAGIFVMTGRVASQDAGPAVMLSFVVAGIGCALAAFCYAEFASMAPVAGSAYTYAYATLGELFAWIIGWDLILEYAMSCATVAAAWSKYFNSFLKVLFGLEVPKQLLYDPFTVSDGVRGVFNLPAVLIMIFVTWILVIGIRQSATTNAVLVAIKLGVVLFVIVVGWGYINRDNWTSVPVYERRGAEEAVVSSHAEKLIEQKEKLIGKAKEERVVAITKEVVALNRIERERADAERLVTQGRLDPKEVLIRVAAVELKFAGDLPKTSEDKALVNELIAEVRVDGEKKATEKWGIIGLLGINRWLIPVDDGTRSPFVPYGLSGIMVGAALVFFAYIGFDSISAHSEEAKKPQRDVPIGIITSLVLCTVLYLLVAAVITGMEPYPEIDVEAAVSEAFARQAEREKSSMLKAAAGLIATGALAGMTSVLLITFLSQARIFLAMARDGLLPPAIFGAIHPRFRTPHISTMITGAIICVVAAFTPILVLEEMVNIGTLLAFVIVCAAVLLLRIKRPDAHRPFRCPAVFIVAPLGMLVNFIMMLFLSVDSWLRLVIWLFVGLILYFCYGYSHSIMGMQLRGLIPAVPMGPAPTDAFSPRGKATDAPVEPLDTDTKE